MEAVLLSNPEVTKLAGERFVATRINTDRLKDMQARYDVRDLPMVAFLAPSGSEVARLPDRDRFSLEKFLDHLRAVPPRAEKALEAERNLRAALEQEPGSLEAARALLKHLTDGRRWEEARALAQETSRSLGTAKGADEMLSQTLYIDLKLRRFPETKAGVRAFVERFPASALRPMVEYWHGLALLHGEKDAAGAIKVWQALIERQPQGTWADRARTMIRRAQESGGG